MATSEATTGSTLYPVMNLMSSMANTLVGSTMAIVRVAKLRLTGMMRYSCANSLVISLTTASSTSTLIRLIAGTPYCWERTRVMSSSLMRPRLTRFSPSLPPLVFWYSRASWSFCGVRSPALINISPSLTAIQILTGILRTDGASCVSMRILEYGVTNYVPEQFLSSDSWKYDYKDLTDRRRMC